jgi:hypothetical protein
MSHSAIVQEAAALVRERTADGEPLFFVYNIDHGRTPARLFPSDLKMLMRRFNFRSYMRNFDSQFDREVANLLRAQSPNRYRLLTFEPRWIERTITKFRRERNKVLRAEVRRGR